MTVQWKTWERVGNFGTRKSRITVTRRALLGQPPGLGWTQRRATEKEIKAEIKAEEQAQIVAANQTDWCARSDIRDADSVRAAIELRLDQVIDRLTPAEWRDLAERLK
jgi:hypothetical protein